MLSSYIRQTVVQTQCLLVFDLPARASDVSIFKGPTAARLHHFGRGRGVLIASGNLVREPWLDH
jgi:hypothetical protein